MRLAVAMIAASRGCDVDDIAAVIDWRSWSDEDGARAEIARFGGTLAGCVVKAAQRLDLVALKPNTAAPGAIGLAAFRGVLGATVCVRGLSGWVTISGLEGLHEVEAGTVLQAWSATHG